MFFYKKLIILELIICLIVVFQYWKAEKQYNNFPFEEELSGTAKIISSKEETNFKNKYIMQYQDNKFVLYTTKEFEYGDIVAFQGYFEKAKSFGNFGFSNYEDYLKEQKIYGFFRTDNVFTISQEKDVFYYLENLKNKLKQNLFDVFDEEKAGFLAGLLIGDKTDILEETKINFQNSSLSHVLAISGLHVIYVSFGMEFVLNLLTKKRRFKNILMIFLLMFFAFFTGGSPSCLRACIMCSMIFLSELLYQENNSYFSLIIALDIVLLINCYYIHSFSLWLSFMATLGILAFRDIVPSHNMMTDSIKISVISNLVNFPITCNRYHTISFTFLISNMMISILIGPIMILGYLHLFLGKLSTSFVFIENTLLEFVFQVAKILGDLKISKLPFPNIPIYFCILYYIVIFVGNYLYRHKEIWKRWKKQILLILAMLIFIRCNCCYSKRKGF